MAPKKLSHRGKAKSKSSAKAPKRPESVADIDASNAAHASKKRRTLGRRDSEEKLNRQIANHFGHLSAQQINTLRVGGERLRDRIIRDKKEMDLSGAERMGMSYWRGIVQEYSDTTSTFNGIEANVDGMEVRRALSDSLDIAIDANSAHRDAAPFITFMATADGLNLREVMGIAKTLEASGSLGITATDPLWLALSQYIGRTAGKHCSDKYLQLLKVKADGALARAWPRQKGNGIGLTTFVTNYRDTLALLVSPADLSAIMGTQGDWLRALPQARRVVAASVTGEALFSFILSLVSTDSLQEVMESALSGFQPAHATREMISNIREQLADDIEDFAEGTTLPKQRFVTVKFLSHDVSVKVSGLDFELELRIAAAVKTEALARGASKLPRLPHEDWIMPEPSTAEFNTEEFVMSPFRAARAYAADVFRARPPACVGDVQKILSAASMDLLRLDPTYCLEVAFAVEVAILKSLPSASRAMTLAESESRLEALGKTDMMSSADRASQSQLDAIKEGVALLRKALPPSYELWSNDGFFKQCLTACGYFCRIPPGHYGNDGDKELLAKEALRVKLTWVRKHLDNAELVNYAVLDDFFKFPWLLAASEQKEVKNMVEKVMARSQASSSSSSAGQKAAKRGSKSQRKESAPASCARFF